MKTHLFRWMLLFVAFAVPWATQAQQTLTVADGEANNQYVPFYGYYADEAQHNQMIYPAVNLSDMVGQSITQMVFYIDPTAGNGTNTAASRMGTWTVSLGETELTSLEGLVDGVALTPVYEGYFDCSTGTLTLEFNLPYIYNGGNLLLDINHAAAGYNRWYFLGAEAEGAAYCYSQSFDFLPKTTFTYEEPPACLQPGGLAITLTPGNGTVAQLSWVENGDATAWQICLNDDEENLIDVTENPYTIVGLTPETEYTVKVRSVCSEPSSWSNSIAFTPTNAFSLTVNEGDATNDYVPIYGYWADNITKSQFIIPADDLAEMTYGNITKLDFHAFTANANWGAAQFEVYMTETDATTLEELADWGELEQVMAAGTLSIVNNIMEVTLTAPYQYMGGNLMIGFLQTATGSYASSKWQGVVSTGASMGGYGSSIGQRDFLPMITFNYSPGEAPACPRPTALSVEYTGGNEATVTWNSEAETFNIDVNGTVTEGVTSPYTLAGLVMATTYTVKVQAVCDEFTTSEWTNPVNFTTDLCMPENQCEITILLTDSYGDGWNGNYMSVVDAETDAVLGTYTLTSGSEGTFTLAVCNGRELNFVYTIPTGSSTYPSENGWLITDINGEAIAEHEGCDNGCRVDPGVIATYTVDCTVTSCRRPTNLDVDIFPRSADITWTENGESTVWLVAYKVSNEDDYTFLDADATNITLTGLTPETEYDFKVRGFDCEGKWSDEITFTTNASCMVPTDVMAVPTAHSAVLSWTENGESTEWIVAYKPVDSEDEPISVSADVNPFTLTGLTPETEYVFTLIGAECTSEWSDEVDFTTPSVCDAPTSLETEDITATSATLVWVGEQLNYNIRYRSATEVEPDAPATVILTAGDVWGDGTGYQMLLDPTATAYGDIIPEDGGLTTSGDASDEIYAAFEYKIPTNADGALTTTNIVIENSIAIQIPAGTYDWCITNPTPGDRMWIAGHYGPSPSRADDFVFEPGATYEFILGKYDANDGVEMTVTPAMGEWTVVEGVTTPYELAGLAPETFYQWQVQGVNEDCTDGVTAWSNSDAFETEAAPAYERLIEETVCDKYELRNSADELLETYTESGNYEYDYDDPDLGPVHATLDLTVNYTDRNHETVVNCGPYYWDVTDRTYNKSGVKTYKGTTAEGCPAYDTLTLTVVDKWSNSETVESCGPYTWEVNGATYNKGGVKTYKSAEPDADGCYTYDTLTLTITPLTGVVETVENCGPYTWAVDGKTYNKGGVKTYTVTNIDGCFVQSTLNLTVVDKWSNSETVESCGPYTWEVNGATYNKGGVKTYKSAEPDADGCYTYDTLTLTITPLTGVVETVENCGPYTWDVDGKTYNKGGVKTYTVTNIDGCFVQSTLNLTVVDKWSSYETVVSCGPYEWDKTGATYNKGGVKYFKGTAPDGCPEYDTLNLVISPAGGSTLEVTSCVPYEWTVDGKTYNKSGVKTYTTLDASNCYHVDTLNLTIIKGYSNRIEVETCTPYYWDVTDRTYNKSGVKTYKSAPDADGCPTYDTLVLNVIKGYGHHEYVESCTPYHWDVTDRTYNKSGVKTFKSAEPDADGCYTYDTLHLTIIKGYSNYEHVEACGPYHWDVTDRTYNKSGVKTFKSAEPDADGCYTYDTLDLVINNCEGSNNGGSFGIGDNDALSQITLYPNPTTGRVQLNVMEADRIEVLDLVGRRVALFENTNTLDLTNLADGTYTLRITMPEGVALRKVVKR